MSLQPFPITTQKTGYFTYLEPWIRPEDAYEPLINAQVYRGSLQKRNGSTQLGNTFADGNPVMGIMRFQNETTGSESLVVATTQNAYLYNPGSNTFSLLTSILNSNFFQGTITGTTMILPTFFQNLTPGSISITDGTTIITDDGAGNLGTGGIFAAGGTIVYATGVATFKFTGGSVGSSVSLKITATTTGGYFSGNIKNFFNWTNWQPTDQTTFTPSTSYLYMTNNVDPVTLFDGTNLSRPFFYTNSAMTQYVKNTFDVKVYRNRLLFVLPTLSTSNIPLNQSVFWSAQYNPFDFQADIAGHGGQLSASTGDLIVSFNFLRDICIIRFTKSVWLFRFTGNDFSPFIFQQINVSKRTNCPYASIQYDERETGIGATGITACDGVNLQRFDVPIIDFYETEMSEQYYSQAFSQRYDNNSEAWTLYVSQANQNPLVGGIAPGSDKALIYNFVENTWATYQFTTPMTCLGIFTVVMGRTWASFSSSPQDEWQNQNNHWFTYSNQKSAPDLLAGDTTGHVYWMDDEQKTTDAGNLITADIVTTRWNPFVQSGQKVQFGYIDFYYARNNACVINLTFYLDNSTTPAATRTLTLDANGNDGNSGSDFAMKRIYINAMGEFLQMEMNSSSSETFQINGVILWAKPAGRLTP